MICLQKTTIGTRINESRMLLTVKKTLLNGEVANVIKIWHVTSRRIWARP